MEQEKNEDKFLKVPYNAHVIAQVYSEGVEHVVCMYPRFWSDQKYLVYKSQIQEKLIEVHCIPQHSRVKFPQHLRSKLSIEKINVGKELEQKTLEEQSFKESELLPLEPEEASEKDVMRIIQSVHALGKLRVKDTRSSGTFEQIDSGTEFYVYQEFLREVTPKIRELKRTYTERVESVSTFRGKLTNTGMVKLVAQPSNRFECRFDEFLVQAPVYRIISTCLDVIMISEYHSILPWLNKEFDGFKADARRLKRNLSMVQSMTLHKAIRELELFISRPPRMFRNLHPLGEVMMRILKREHIGLSDQGEAKTKLLMKRETEKIWEDFLEIGLKEIFGNQSVQTQSDYDEAWDGVGSTKFIDFSINEGSELIDAKYMNASNVFGASYQHQMFFYFMAETAAQLEKNGSGTSQEKVGPRRISLAYPVCVDKLPASPETPPEFSPNQFDKMLNKLNARHTKLRRIGLPFPDSSWINDWIMKNQDKTSSHDGWVREFVRDKDYEAFYSRLT
jgi:hypothetical protein